MIRFLLSLTLLLSVDTFAAELPNACEQSAKARAKQLLIFHIGQEDDRISIRDEVKILPPIKNPINPKQKFDVLEVWGDIYKGQYRMHFLYYNGQGVKCLLMGEEILEYANI